jgi:hypothetical protein
MEYVTLDIEGCHVRIVYLETLRIEARIDLHRTVWAALVVVEAISSTTVSRLVRGLPRHVWVVRIAYGKVQAARLLPVPFRPVDA